MTIERIGPGRWRITLKDAETVYDGPGTATPCSVVAEGGFFGARMDAPVVPYDIDGYEVSADEIPPNNSLLIDFSRTIAFVRDGASPGICGLNANMGGDYRRIR